MPVLKAIWDQMRLAGARSAKRGEGLVAVGRRRSVAFLVVLVLLLLLVIVSHDARQRGRITGKVSHVSNTNGEADLRAHRREHLEGAEDAVALRKAMDDVRREVVRMRWLLSDRVRAPEAATDSSDAAVRSGTGAAHRASPAESGLPNEVRHLAPRLDHPLIDEPASPHDVPTIFVSFASFRDAECSRTLEDLFAKAAIPQRVFVGVVEQRDASDPSCMSPEVTRCAHSEPSERSFWGPSLEASRFCLRANIRHRLISSREAKGPTFGRYIAALMYRGETYFMLLDSHNRFVLGWDRLIIDEHARVVALRRVHEAADGSAERVVLSHYPAAFHASVDLRSGHEHYMRLMCSGHFLDTGIFRMDSETIQRLNVPVRQPFTAAGFLFGPGQLVVDVPFDPYLDYLFDGEEILYSARLFTHGYDSYLPTVNIAYHFYVRPDAPKVWSVPNNFWWVHQKISHGRVLTILNVTLTVEVQKSLDGAVGGHRLTRELATYGVGERRSLKSFWAYAQIDPERRLNTPSGYCRGLVAAATRPE